MKAGKNTVKDFFVKEPKFSVLIVLLAIVMLVVLLFFIDISTVVPFSLLEAPVEHGLHDIIAHGLNRGQ
ncbi:MAG: hypothetical protein ACLFQ0_07335 [Cyclobacteriaceae bacterium]